MANTDYNYNIQSDFPNHKVDPTRLLGEIKASAIVTALDHIGTFEGVCSIVFVDPLSGGDETILDGLVAVHSGDPIIPILDVSGTSTITRTANSYALMTDMTLTLDPGDYLVSYSVDVTHSTNGKLICAALFNNGVEVTASERLYVKSTGGGNVCLAAMAKITVISGAVDLRWKTNGAAATSTRRSMSAIKVV